VPGRGITASYGIRFWVLVVLIGVGAGLGGAALMLLLHAIQHLAWGYREGEFLRGVTRDKDVHRVLVLLIGGLFAGVAGTLLARLPGRADVSAALWLHGARLPFIKSIAQGVDSIVTVALGASLGREAGPQQTGAALASLLAMRERLPDWQRRLLVACGAGAGIAAVYNVPLGGALFALEVLLGTLTLPLVLPALATSTIATAVAWIALPDRPTYIVPPLGLHTSQIVWAIIVGPIAGLAAVGFVHLIARAHAIRPTTTRPRLLAPVLVFGALGLLAMQYPQLLGNGKDLVQLTLVGRLGIGLLAVLLVLKPLATAGCLGSGASGGLFTPTLAFGVLLGGLLGEAWVHIWPGGLEGSFAAIGGAAVLAAAMQGPLAAVVLMVELTHRVDALMVPILIAVVGATVVTRLLRAPSIYSARIAEPRERDGDVAPDEPAGRDGSRGEAAEEEEAPGDLLPPSLGI
jgi:H+/Cl- antiporter ClcA